jgi:hypothetical protein
MTKIEEVIETVFLPDLGTFAYICKGGKIYIQLQVGRFFDKKSFKNNPVFKGFNKEFKAPRFKLFKDLETYYKKKYEKN